ncbi:MAG: outer membrane protein transport protein [Campylobacteraceae bacterium]|jgi:long-chain fatty acid transport protein|nr:outer membrane protein transport protein [Campylobacteraceae bacterium]
MKTVYKTALLVAGVSTMLNASGYKIPEQSLRGLALGVANIAAVDGSDASYYNPANMAFMSEPRHELELGFTYIQLPSMTFEHAMSSAYNANSKVEHFVLPYAHIVVPNFYENWRYGFSLVVPGGLAKRWDGILGETYAKKFSLKIIEANPTAAYKINDHFALGFGLRALYTDGIVTNNMYGGMAHRKLTGDSFDFGYNLALSARPIEGLALAATYRSKVDLTIGGNARASVMGTEIYSGKASVDAILPATLSLATAYTYKDTTLEFVYEKTYWSKYKELDFNYSTPLPAVFDEPVYKGWKNSNAFRLGLTHKYSDDLTLMAGFAIDKSAAPDSTLSFELPDSDSKLYSGGFEYKINDDMSIGAAYVFTDKEKRKIDHDGVAGEFKDGSAHLATMTFKYRF